MTTLHDVLQLPFESTLRGVVRQLPPALAEFCVEAPGLTTAQALQRLGLTPGQPVELPRYGEVGYGMHERARALRDLGAAEENLFRVLFR